MSGLEFRLRYPDGRTEQLVVDSDRVLIGSGAHCEIRLPAADAQVEHVLVSSTGGGVYAQARALHPPPTINGSSFTQAPLLPDSILAVGSVEILVHVVEVEGNANVIKKKKESTSPLTYVLAIVAIPLSLYILFDDPPDQTGGDMPTEIPSLWAAAAPACPPAASDQVESLANSKRIAAEGKRERSPFHVQDGVAAVPLFQTAAACFTKAEQVEAAKAMQEAAQKLQKSLEEDYRAHQMRLEHAISVRDLNTAQKEVKALLAMLEGQNGPYVVWLSNLDRRIAIKLGQANQ